VSALLSVISLDCVKKGTQTGPLIHALLRARSIQDVIGGKTGGGRESKHNNLLGEKRERIWKCCTNNEGNGKKGEGARKKDLAGSKKGEGA